MVFLELELHENDMCGFARSFAAQLRAGDCIALSGDVGAGKSTFVRAAIMALTGAEDVPSPTFTLVQHYDAPKNNIAHFDLYRLKTPDEIYELGFEEARASIVFIEWPENAAQLLPANRLMIDITTCHDGSARILRFSGAHWEERLHTLGARQTQLKAFLLAEGWEGADTQHMPGDFSARCYARLKRNESSPSHALAMMMPDAASLQPFLRMQELLHKHGLAVPQVFAKDEAHGLALIEDCGNVRLDTLLDAGEDAAPLYAKCMDALSSLHHRAINPDAASVSVPLFNAPRFLEQASLFLDVYGPLVLGRAWEGEARAAFHAAWKPALDAACQTPQSFLLRDCHAANIMMKENEEGDVVPVFIDFQDGGVGPVAYDIASLLEDARRDVDQNLRAAMIARYLAGQNKMDAGAFKQSYAVLAAQRHIRVLAIVARRWLQDGAPDAQDFFKRSWRLLMLHKNEPLLKDVFAWLAAHVPPSKQEEYQP